MSSQDALDHIAGRPFGKKQRAAWYKSRKEEEEKKLNLKDDYYGVMCRAKAMEERRKQMRKECGLE